MSKEQEVLEILQEMTKNMSEGLSKLSEVFERLNEPKNCYNESVEEIYKQFVDLVQDHSTDEVINEINKCKRYSLADIIYLIQNNAISDALLGKIITIPNAGRCNLFKIIGVNYEGTSNTIDAQSIHNAIPEQYFDDSTNIYKDSSIRKYLNNEYLEGFCKLAKDLMVTMQVKSNGDVLNDKVKILSMTEMGMEEYINDRIVQNEGEEYPLYIHMLKDTVEDHDYIIHMTRSRDLGYGSGVWRIYSNGGVSYDGVDYERGAAPVIRLGKQ